MTKPQAIAVLSALGLVLIGGPVGIFFYEHAQTVELGELCHHDAECRGAWSRCVILTPPRSMGGAFEYLPQDASGSCSRTCDTDAECPSTMPCREVSSFSTSPGRVLKEAVGSQRMCLR